MSNLQLRIIGHQNHQNVITGEEGQHTHTAIIGLNEVPLKLGENGKRTVQLVNKSQIKMHFIITRYVQGSNLQDSIENKISVSIWMFLFQSQTPRIFKNVSDLHSNMQIV